MGTATGRANFFRSIGGAFIVAIFGAIVIGGSGLRGAASFEALGAAAAQSGADLAQVFRYVFVAALVGFGLSLAFLLAWRNCPCAAPPSGPRRRPSPIESSDGCRDLQPRGYFGPEPRSQGTRRDRISIEGEDLEHRRLFFRVRALFGGLGEHSCALPTRLSLEVLEALNVQVGTSSPELPHAVCSRILRTRFHAGAMM